MTNLGCLSADSDSQGLITQQVKRWTGIPSHFESRSTQHIFQLTSAILETH